MSRIDRRYFERLYAYFTHVHESNSGHFNPSGSAVGTYNTNRSKSLIYTLVLPRGSMAKVCLNDEGKVRWFSITVPNFGVVHIDSDTTLIGVIAERVDRYLSALGL